MKQLAVGLLFGTFCAFVLWIYDRTEPDEPQSEPINTVTDSWVVPILMGDTVVYFDSLAWPKYIKLVGTDGSAEVHIYFPINDSVWIERIIQ